jgi:pyrimidine-nucleoside phosphorylase
VDLGGGRAKKGDPVDPAVGIVLSEQGKVGQQVEMGEPLLWIHARTTGALESARVRLANAYGFSDAPVVPAPLIYRIIRSAQ